MNNREHLIMAEAIKIANRKRDIKVDIDGNIWSINLPGAGTELMLSQAQRRIKQLDRKVESGNATDEDLDEYDRLELTFYNLFRNMLSDGTEENASVHKWIDETPMAVIAQVFEEIKEQANGRRDEPPTSTE
jgi:hypothetical protein